MERRMQSADSRERKGPAKAGKEPGPHFEGIILPKLRQAQRVCRSKLIQVKVAPELKRKAETRARSLDMDLSEYVRFLLTRDIHGI